MSDYHVDTNRPLLVPKNKRKFEAKAAVAKEKPNGELVTKAFAQQAIAFPDRVDKALSEIETVAGAKDLLDKATVMQHYADRLKAGVEVEKPIAVGVLKIKAKLGELMPAKPPSDRGQGRNGKSSTSDVHDFHRNTVAAYRKIAANKDKLEEYIEATDDVPTQTDFIKFATGGAHVAKNTGEHEWYTPSDYLDAARKAMGSIELDPASSEVAQKTVKADRYFTKADNGLDQEWTANTLWLNPPYAQPLIDKFSQKLCDAIESNSVKQAVVLVNNASETAWFQRMVRAADAVCLVSGRVRFLDEDGKPGTPLQGQAALYFGLRARAFADRFASLGVILQPLTSTKKDRHPQS